MMMRTVGDSCGCNGKDMMRTQIESWIDIERTMPADPMDLIAYASLNNIAGAYANSGTFNGSSWVASGLTVFNEPLVESLATDQAATVSHAEQWNFSHQTAKLTGALPLRNVIFLRAGRNWSNKIILAFGGASFNEVELSFRDNAGTRGDAAGTVPTIGWDTNVFTGNVTLNVTLNGTGVAIMGLAMRNSGSGDRSMFEMEWHIVD